MPAYAQERRPCYRLGRTRRPRALVPGEEACGIRRSAKGARGDQRRHTCQCPALIAMPTGFPAAIPANCSFQLCSFRGSLVTTQAAEASRAADDVVRRRQRNRRHRSYLPRGSVQPFAVLVQRRCRYLRVRPVHVLSSLIKVSVLVVVFFAEPDSPRLVPNRMVTPSSPPRSSRASSGSILLGIRCPFWLPRDVTRCRRLSSELSYILVGFRRCHYGPYVLFGVCVCSVRRRLDTPVCGHFVWSWISRNAWKCPRLSLEQSYG